MSRIRMKEYKPKWRPTDDEVAKLTFGATRCTGCQGPPIIAIRTYTPVWEFMKKEPDLCKAIGMLSGGALPTVKMKWGEMLRISEVFACRSCRREAEKAAAKAPDWAFVEVEDALPKTKIVSQVPAAYRSQ